MGGRGGGGGGLENDEDLIEGNVYLLVEAKPFSHDGGGGGGGGEENDVDLRV